MGWGFRKSIKIAPGVRVNLSKSGVSTSIGGRGFTYNTRGRTTVSIPGTGIRYTKTASSGKAAQAVQGRASDTGKMSPSKREIATLEFLETVQDRLCSALQKYFFSHGVYVEKEDLDAAVSLEDHQSLVNSLENEFDITTSAVRLASDLGTLSLAEKEKAMKAVYTIEKECKARSGNNTGLQSAANWLSVAIHTFPAPPTLKNAFIAIIAGNVLLLTSAFVAGILVVAASAGYVLYVLRKFEAKKASALKDIAQAEVEFNSVVKTEITARPALMQTKDLTRRNCMVLACVSAVIAVLAVVSHMRGGFAPVEGNSTAELSTSQGERHSTITSGDAKATDESVSPNAKGAVGASTPPIVGKSAQSAR
ncbi:hypothetical protein BH160DRAFT_5829 [Burkholderia sp. H160]|nr:hypothetical protein BH160DRAFT_5829 [Burkholderia sp. H160]